MKQGSAFWRAAAFAAAAFTASALWCAWLFASAAPQRLLVWAFVGHGVACAVVLGGLWWLARGLRQPMAEIVAQIESAGQGRLVEHPQSRAAELVPVSRALNVAVVRLAAQIADRDHRLGELQTEVSVDELTGLSARVLFMDRFVGMLRTPDTNVTGGLAILRIDDLAGLNQRTGRDRTDELLRSVATLLRTRAVRLSPNDHMVARLNGADFAVLALHVEAAALGTWLNELADGLHGLKQQELTDRPRVGWVAASVFNAGESPGAVLSRVDRALQAGEAGNTAAQFIRHNRSGPAVPIAKWRGLIDDALGTGRIALRFDDALDAQGRVHHQLAQVRLTNHEGRVFDEDELLPAALRTARMSDIDLRAAELALTHIAEHDTDVLLRVSARSAERPSFVSRLDAAMAVLGANASRLWVAVDIGGERQLVGVLEPLAQAITRHGARLGIDQLHNPPEDLAPLRHLRIRFMRLAPSLMSGLAAEGHSGKRMLLQLMVNLGKTEGMQVLAGPAATASDAQILHGMGVVCMPPAVLPIEEIGATADTASRPAAAAALAVFSG